MIPRSGKSAVYSKVAATVCGLLSGALMFLVLATPALACQICIPYPRKTSVDHIIGSEIVVLALANQTARFTYEPTEVLKGRYDGKAITLLVNSVTGSTLAQDPALRVVLVQDRSDGPWISLGIAGSEYQRLLREVAHWCARSRSAAERAVFFSPYLMSEDAALTELAFLEVGRAPYSTVRRLSAGVPREEIYRVLNDWFRIEWHALYVLMLGMLERPDDIAFVRGKLEVAAKFGLTTSLGAYAIAYVEMMDAEAVGFLVEEYFRKGAHSPEELIEILKALSTHGHAGDVELRAEIVEAYGELLAHRPELAGYVASDLLDWNVTRFAARMKEILDADIALDEPSELAIATYLSIGQ